MNTKIDAALRLIDGLDAELEKDIRSKINPQYEDTFGTESYERKRLIGEIDRLRSALRLQIMIYQVSDEAWDREADADRIMARVLSAPNA